MENVDKEKLEALRDRWGKEINGIQGVQKAERENLLSALENSDISGEDLKQILEGREELKYTEIRPLSEERKTEIMQMVDNMEIKVNKTKFGSEVEFEVGGKTFKMPTRKTRESEIRGLKEAKEYLDSNKQHEIIPYFDIWKFAGLQNPIEGDFMARYIIGMPYKSSELAGPILDINNTPKNTNNVNKVEKLFVFGDEDYDSKLFMIGE